MNIKLLNELINKIVSEFIGDDNRDFISEIHEHDLFYIKENYDLVFKKTKIFIFFFFIHHFVLSFLIKYNKIL